MLREGVDLLLDDDGRAGGFSTRFAGVVLPEETILGRAREEKGRIALAAHVSRDRRDHAGAPVLSDRVLTPGDPTTPRPARPPAARAR